MKKSVSILCIFTYQKTKVIFGISSDEEKKLPLVNELDFKISAFMYTFR